ncbi:MAG: Gfo/Idh/MocA family oxidoreductase [Bacteroidales bacterium]|nr:Gfo/Idh/MocA family oxidoreductase [Bacteroidales bacterium]MCF8390090.1 Gfo/Idh/MocA family oxidoreductase [Bacteroidales bacterium]
MERRDFLIKSSLASLGAGLILSGCKQVAAPIVIPDGERIRVGIVGLGDRGSTIIRVLNKIPEMKIIAACDILDFRLTDGLAKINEKATGYSDYRKMLENKEIEAVIISVPLHEHHRMVMDALDTDVHIMCEKALAHSIEQSKEIKIKADKSPKLFQIAYQYQLNPTFNVIKDIIHKGFLGKVMRIDAKWHRNSNWLRPVPRPELERQINWRMYREYSGGLMAELGSHHLNMIDNIIGEHPLKVVGTGGVDYWKDGREVFDNVFAVYDYPGGIKASFSSILSNKFEDQIIKFYGDKGTIVVNRMKEAFIYSEDLENAGWGEDIDAVSGASIKIVNRDKDSRRTINLPKEAQKNPVFEDDYEHATWLLYKNFAAAIKGEEELALGLKDGYQSAISVHMANRAIREERIEKWLPEYDV